MTTLLPSDIQMYWTLNVHRLHFKLVSTAPVVLLWCHNQLQIN
jgi:hypothetical protein